jgi:hypothetical protein
VKQSEAEGTEKQSEAERTEHVGADVPLRCVRVATDTERGERREEGRREGGKRDGGRRE